MTKVDALILTSAMTLSVSLILTSHDCLKTISSWNKRSSLWMKKTISLLPSYMSETTKLQDWWARIERTEAKFMTSNREMKITSHVCTTSVNNCHMRNEKSKSWKEEWSILTTWSDHPSIPSRTSTTLCRTACLVESRAWLMNTQTKIWLLLTSTSIVLVRTVVKVAEWKQWLVKSHWMCSNMVQNHQEQETIDVNLMPIIESSEHREQWVRLNKLRSKVKTFFEM